MASRNGVYFGKNELLEEHMSNFDVNAPRFERNLTMPDRDTILVVAGGLSIVLAATAGVWLAFRTRRPPTRIERAEASLAHAATRAEQAARTVRKQAPSIVERSAARVEQAARTVRKQGPTAIERGGARIEQWGRAIRKQGPGMLAEGAERVEQAARTVRKQAPGIVAERAGRAEKAARHVRKHGPARLRAGYEQTEHAWNRTREMSAEVGNKASETLEKSRKAGAEATSAAQHLGQRLRVRFQRGR